MSLPKSESMRLFSILCNRPTHGFTYEFNYTKPNNYTIETEAVPVEISDRQETLFTSDHNIFS